MKRPVYAIRDVAVGFGSPFVDVNDASARRNFSFAGITNKSIRIRTKKHKKLPPVK